MAGCTPRNVYRTGTTHYCYLYVVENKNKNMVRKGGLEPPCLSAPPPQDGVSANFTTSAQHSRQKRRGGSSIAKAWCCATRASAGSMRRQIRRIQGGVHVSLRTSPGQHAGLLGAGEIGAIDVSDASAAAHWAARAICHAVVQLAREGAQFSRSRAQVSRALHDLADNAPEVLLHNDLRRCNCGTRTVIQLMSHSESPENRRAKPSAAGRELHAASDSTSVG